MFLITLYIAIPAIITIANFSLAAYLFYQFNLSLDQNSSRRHWVRFWASGLVLFLIGSPAFLIWFARMELFFPQYFRGGFLLILISTALYAFAVWRCCQKQADQSMGIALEENRKNI